MSKQSTDADVAFIQALAELLNKNGLTELSVKREYGEDDSLEVRVVKQANVVTVAAAPAPVAYAPAPAAAAAPVAAAAPAAAAEDPAAALAGYRKGLSLGGTRPLPELFAAAGVRFDFTQAPPPGSLGARCGARFFRPFSG